MQIGNAAFATVEERRSRRQLTPQQATTLTITNCPCTITKPLTTNSAVVCNNKENWYVASPPSCARHGFV